MREIEDVEDIDIFKNILDIDIDFDINVTATESPAITEKIIKDKAIKRKIKNEEVHTKKINQLNQLCIAPKKGEQWRIITEKQFNAYALIKFVVENNVIDELYLAIYRINEPTVDSIIKMVNDGKIKKATFIISNFFNQTKKPEAWALKLREYCEQSDLCDHAYVHNHSKVVCMKTGDDYYVFEGSGNMSDNARIEQYVYENSLTMFEFHKEWMDYLVAMKHKGDKSVAY